MVDTKALRQQHQLLKEQRKSNDMLRQQNRLLSEQNRRGAKTDAGNSGQGKGPETFMGSLGKIAGAVGGALGETLSELKEDFRTSGGILSDHMKSEIQKGQLGYQTAEGVHDISGQKGEDFLPSGPTNPLAASPVWQHLMVGGKPKTQLDTYAHTTSSGILKTYLAGLQAENAFPFTASLVTINLGSTDADKTLLADFTTALAKHPNLYGSVGYGPRNLVEDVDALDEHLTALINTQPKLIALGPIGLDAPYASHTLPQQIAQLTRQLEIAADFGLPVFLRNLGATPQLVEVLNSLETKPTLIYTRPPTTPEEKNLILAHDMHILLRSELTWPEQGAYRQMVVNIPRLRWLLASGNGLTASESNKGKTNTSASLPEVLNTLAELMKQDPDTLLSTLNANAYRLFYQE